MKNNKTDYQKAKAYLKGFAVSAKIDFKGYKPAIRAEINIQAHSLASNMNLNEYKTNLLHDYACKLYPKD